MGEVEPRPLGIPLGALADEINAEHRAFVGSVRTTLEHGIRCGELLAEAKGQCKHGEWLPWLKANFEGSTRSAQEYMRLYHHREEIRAKYAATAHLGVSDALKELAASARPDDLPPEEWEIVRRAREEVGWATGPPVERLVGLPENKRRGFVAEMAWSAMVCQGKEYAEVLYLIEEMIEEEGPRNVTPEMLTSLQAEADKLRWWVGRVEWIEGLVRACDWPPGMGMPREAFDEEKKYLPLSELYDDESENGLPSPRGRIREFCGAVV